MITTRVFDANVGDPSTGKGGPDAIETDIDNLIANDIELGQSIGNFADHLNDTGNPHSVTKTQVNLGNVTNDKQMPISGGVLENYTEKLITLTGTSPAVNLNNGNNFIHILSGDTSYGFFNSVNSTAHSFTIMLIQPSTAVTITFPISVKWQNDEAPDLKINGSTHILSFMTINGGTTWFELGRVSYDVS